MKEVLFGIQSRLKEKRNLRLHLRVDNQTVVANINKMGRPIPGQMTTVTKKLWDYWLERKVFLSLEHLPGINNHQADSLSRAKPESSD